MTPDEFESHPYAVFHAARTTADEMAERPFVGAATDWWGNRHEPEVQPMHAGTERSALERSSDYFYAPDLQGRTSPWKMHTFWAVPNKEEIRHGARYTDDHRLPPTQLRNAVQKANTVGDTYDAQNEPANKEAYGDTLGYYVNGVEDLGSVSTVTRRPDTRYQTHADFVRKAIDSGRGDEVHPLTMAMYKQGKLSQGREITEDEAMHARRTSSNYRLRTPLMDQHYEELDRQEGRRSNTTGQAMFDFTEGKGTEHPEWKNWYEPTTNAEAGYFTHPNEDVPTPHGGFDRGGQNVTLSTDNQGNRRVIRANTLMQVTPEPEIPEPTRGPNLSRIRKQRKLDRYKNY